ncbi:MAG: hypothetical protein NC235_07615 [Clostridiales bacterium]|nr:hypothetical protein [Clostridiales bacterium]MCM1576976.1 hypothetical protein [Bacteroides sp.]
MKTIREALIDEIHYPIPTGYVENVLIKRDLDCDEIFTTEVARSKQFIGAKADCLISLIQAPNFNEADKSFSLGDKNLILKLANSLYRSIGEEEKSIDRPMVYIGG